MVHELVVFGFHPALVIEAVSVGPINWITLLASGGYECSSHLTCHSLDTPNEARAWPIRATGSPVVKCAAERREERRGCPVRSHVDGLLGFRGEAGGGTATGDAESSWTVCGAGSDCFSGGA